MVLQLLLIGAGRIDYAVLNTVGDAVKERMPVPTEVLKPVWKENIPLTLYDFKRMQFRADLVNMFLARRFGSLVSPPERLLVAIIAGDAYVPGLNFVFGLASPELGVASVYLARIQGERLLERLIKLILHETGHLLGLGHCSNPSCVMRFSNSIVELDSKGDRFCPVCTARLKRVFGLD